MKEKFEQRYTSYYDTKMIIKFEKINDTRIETYLECKDGKILLKTYINDKLSTAFQLGDIGGEKDGSK